MLILAAVVPILAYADDYVGGLPLTTVQTGTVSGGLWYDMTPAPDWGIQDVSKTFTIPAAAVAEPGRIQWARLYVSAYCAHMQNDYAFTITNKWDGNGDGVYDQTWPETVHAPFHYQVAQDDGIVGNDNAALGGGGSDPYKMINGHETRVTSDYLMYYDVASLIHGQIITVNVNTEGSLDGRIKVITLLVAYNDGDSDRIRYWVNQGHDVCSYYTEDSFDSVAIGTTTFGTTGITPVSEATLTIGYMASNSGNYGFPTGENNFNATTKDGAFVHSLSRTPDVQGPYSGVITWNVTGQIDGRSDVSLSYARYLPATGTAAFYKLPLAVLTAKLEAPPEAGFSANVTTGEAPLAVKFTDNSTGNITSRAWDFNGDGVVDSVQSSPEFTYSLPGNYTVKLTVTGPSGSGNVTARINVTVPPIPIADFTVNASSGYVPLTVHFTDISSNRPTGWDWDFDNDSIVDSHEQNPTHTYEAAGVYTVKLVSANVGGSNATIEKDLITAVLPPVPSADFSASPTEGIMPLIVQYTDTSINQPSSWLWDFGDGNTSTGQNPSHTYSTPGHYTISLTATNAGGSDTETRDGYIYIKHMIPVAGFTSDVKMGMAPLAVHFTDTSANQPSSWLWDFGDGNASTEQNPSHTYSTPGHYTISLTATNDGGTNAFVLNGYITVTDRPVYYLSPATSANTPGKEVVFDIIAQSLPDGLKKYGVNISLDKPGVAGISRVEYPLWATVNGTSVDGNMIRLEAWDSGNMVTAGMADVKLASITLTCAGPGTTAILLSGPWMDDDEGVSSIPVTVDGNLSVYVPLHAELNANVTDGAIPLEINFGDISTGTPGPSGWLWDFGDGSTSTEKNTTHIYEVQGKYTANLTVTNEYCTDRASVRINVTSPVPVANFTWNQTRGPTPLTVRFTDESTGNIDSWNWSFGDGNTSVEQNPTHTYVTPNGVNPLYTVMLTVTNDGGSNTKTANELIKVDYPLPVADFFAGPVSGDLPLTVQFTDRSLYASTWYWEFGDGNTSDQRNATHTYVTAGNYTVKLTVTGSGGTDNEVRTGYIKAGVQPQCDLLMTGSVSPIGGVVFAREPNTVYVFKINNSGPMPSTQTEVELRSDDGFSGRATIPALGAKQNTTVSVIDTRIRSLAGPTVTYTAVLDPDNLVAETNEDNNQKSSAAEAITYNGYKSKRYWEGGGDDTTVKAYDLRGGIVHSFGDSAYVSGSFGTNGWNSYAVDWKAVDLVIPKNATIKEARLYVPYTWDNNNVAPDHVHITFNGQGVDYQHWYHDVSNFGAYKDHVYGLLTYDVTSLYRKNADNKATFAREGNPVTTKISPYGFTLAVIYEDANATRKQIFMNEEFDLLGADPSGYGTDPAEATAYVPFSGMAIDMANVSHAYLITFVPSGVAQETGRNGEGNLLFNGNVIGTDVWDHGPMTGPQVAVNTRDVKAYLKSSDNVAGIQSTTGSTPCMAAAQEFLVIEYNTPGALPDETLNATLSAVNGGADKPASPDAPSTAGPDAGTDTAPASSDSTTGGTTPLSTILVLLIVIVLTGAAGLALLYFINGSKVPVKIGIPAILAAAVMISAIGGFVLGQSAQVIDTAHNSSAVEVTPGTPNASFSVITTIQGIEDDNRSNLVPDYPPGFNADNGILFVHDRGGQVKVADVKICLKSHGEEVTIGPSDTMPADRCTSEKVTGYIRELGGSDGIISGGEWLMLYADGCFESAGDPARKAISWDPAGRSFALYEGETCDYTIMDASGGVIQEGNFQFNP